MKSRGRALVTGAGGFIGYHLVSRLKSNGFWVRAVDVKYPEFEKTNADEFILLDLRISQNTLRATGGIDEVYHLASNMGGVGFIESARARLMYDNIFIDTNMLEASRENSVKKFFYSSSALVYPPKNMRSLKNAGYKERDAYPANPSSEYGWEKLFMERLCAIYYADYGLETRIARFHNVYGPLGVYEGGREKSPAAICRKIALAKDGDEIEVWGDGRQARSYCYIDDCIEGIDRLMQSDIREPLNIGSHQVITINGLIDIVARIAGKTIRKRYDVSKPQGVRYVNSDNTKIRTLLKWEPAISLEYGFAKTYQWIARQIAYQRKKRSS